MLLQYFLDQVPPSITDGATSHPTCGVTLKLDWPPLFFFLIDEVIMVDCLGCALQPGPVEALEGAPNSFAGPSQ